MASLVLRAPGGAAAAGSCSAPAQSAVLAVARELRAARGASLGRADRAAAAVRVHSAVASALAEDLDAAQVRALLTALSTFLRRSAGAAGAAASGKSAGKVASEWYSAALASLEGTAADPSGAGSAAPGAAASWAQAAVEPLLAAQVLMLGARGEALGVSCSGCPEAVEWRLLPLATSAFAAAAGADAGAGAGEGAACPADVVERTAAVVGSGSSLAVGSLVPSRLVVLLRLARRWRRAAELLTCGEEVAAAAAAARLARSVVLADAKWAARRLDGGERRRQSFSAGARCDPGATHEVARAAVAEWDAALAAVKVHAACAEDLEAAAAAVGRLGAADSDALSAAVAAAKAGGGAALWTALVGGGDSPSVSSPVAVKLFDALARQASVAASGSAGLVGGGAGTGATTGSEAPLFVIDRVGEAGGVGVFAGGDDASASE